MRKEKVNIKKLVCVIISLIIVIINLESSILISNIQTEVKLFTFESIYLYLFASFISIYQITNNKKANLTIFISLCTYLHTYILVKQMLTYITEVEIHITSSFYIYLTSSIFLIISLFINNKIDNKKVTNTKENNIPILNNTINKNNFLFSNFILGLKEIPFDTTILLVNNTIDHQLELIYNINSKNKTISFSYTTIKDIKYTNKIGMINKIKNKSNELNGTLLSAVVFGGNPILQLQGNTMFNSLLDDITNNYEKIEYNVYYEIEINILTLDSKNIKLILKSSTNPKIFINQVLNSAKTTQDI